jgi:NAD(P)-dependent dehydrogenase (short-subunit alcohol dehydrogenase family)
MARLEGKVAIVTGGASGIGLATVERFAAEGARVVVADVQDGSAIAARLGEAVRFVAADVTIGAQLEEVFAVAQREFGGVDVVFNNAGVGGDEGTVAECREDVFDRTIAVDLKGVWRGIQLGARALSERGGGSIISTGSVAGLRGVPGMGSYSAAKGAVIALTRVAAMELAASNVRVNCICPGAIVTPMISESPSLPMPIDPDVLRLALSGAQPMPRAGEGADIASAALFLASDESSFVTGQVLVVDGGASAEADARTRTQDVAATLGLQI